MTKIQIFILLLLTSFVGTAQFFDENVQTDPSGQIEVLVNGDKQKVTVDKDHQNYRFVLGGLTELKQYQAQRSPFKVLSVDSTVLANQDVKKKYVLEVGEIRIGKVSLKNYVVEFEYTYSDQGGRRRTTSEAAPKVGMGNLRSFANAQFAGSTLKLEDIQCLYHVNPSNCNPLGSGTSGGGVMPSGSSLTVRIVPCSNDTEVTQLKNQLRTWLGTKGVTIEEETNVPPLKAAVDRVDEGLTLRYFDQNDEPIASQYIQGLEARFAGSDVMKENMVPYYNNAMPSYLEIWIK